jgi:hypothetical protein
VGAELREEIAKISGSEDEFDVSATEQRLNELELEVSGQGCDRTQANDMLSSGASVAQDFNQFFAGAENRLCVF